MKVEGWRLEGWRLEGWRVGGLEGWRVGGLEGWRLFGLGVLCREGFKIEFFKIESFEFGRVWER
ncbi:hypothetical protein BI334_15120 [Moorena producens 3L]|nr:hypothetical protein BI334_15120 [Moorena producens 3L]